MPDEVIYTGIANNGALSPLSSYLLGKIVPLEKPYELRLNETSLKVNLT